MAVLDRFHCTHVNVDRFWHYSTSPLTLAGPESEHSRLGWTECAVRIGGNHHGVLFIGLESSYLTSSGCLSGDNVVSITPGYIIHVSPSTSGRWAGPG